MSPPLGLSSIGQEAHYPDPLDNPALDSPHVKESGSDPSIRVTPTLERFNLFIHTQYRTIHCRNITESGECNTAQLPYAVAGHLNAQHQYVFNRKEKKDLEAYLLTQNPVKDKTVFINPEPGLAPVKGLKMKNGLCCKKCSYAVRSESSMKHHWSKVHKGQAHHIRPRERWRGRLGTALLQCT